MSEYSTVTEGGVTVSSNSESAEQITEILKPADAPTEEEKVSKAASELGKKGGEAAAAVRRAKAKEEAKSEKALGRDDSGAKPGLQRDGSGPDSDGEASELGAEAVQPDSPGTSEPDKPLGKPRDDPRARMLEATRQAAEAKREAAAERAERARLAAELEQLRAGKPTEQSQPKAATEPKEEDFENYRDFVDARAAWKFNQLYEERQKQQAQQYEAHAYQRAVEARVSKFNERLAEHDKAEPGFLERVSTEIKGLEPSFMLQDPRTLGPLNVVADEIFSSKHAPALMLHFTEHPEELERLKALNSPTDVQLEVRLIAKSLEAAPAASSPKLVEVSRAKPPVRPVSGSPHVADQPPADDAPYEAHRAYWGRRDRERARR